MNWTEKELALIRNEYSKNRLKSLLSLLPGRTAAAVSSKAHSLGLVRDRRGNESAMPKLSPVEVAYIAGLFDGEGCIHISRHIPHAGGINVSHVLQVSLVNTNRDVISYLHRTLGGNSRQAKAYGQMRRETAIWQTSSARALSFLEMIYPFLRIKREEADVAIRFAVSQFVSKRRSTLTTDDITMRECFRMALSSLKGRIKNGTDAVQ